MGNDIYEINTPERSIYPYLLGYFKDMENKEENAQMVVQGIISILKRDGYLKEEENGGK